MRKHYRPQAKQQQAKIFQNNLCNQFERCYAAAVKHLERQYRLAGQTKQLRKLQITDFATEYVSPSLHAGVTLGKFFPKTAVGPARMVVYRAPIEYRAHSADELTSLLIELLSESLD
jgi:hypothetical protein